MRVGMRENERENEKERWLGNHEYSYNRGISSLPLEKKNCDVGALSQLWDLFCQLRVFLLL
jgi:hypothetical protein